MCRQSGREVKLLRMDPLSASYTTGSLFRGFAFVFHSIFSQEINTCSSKLGNNQPYFDGCSRVCLYIVLTEVCAYSLVRYVLCVTLVFPHYVGHHTCCFCETCCHGFALSSVLLDSQLLGLFLKAHKSWDRCAHSKAATH